MNKEPYQKLTIPRFKKGIKFPSMPNLRDDEFMKSIGMGLAKHAKKVFGEKNELRR